MTLQPGAKVAAADVSVPLEGLAGYVELAAFGEVEVGVWEHAEGVSEDIEADEVFVVISGAARIDFIEPELPSLEIGPGDIVRLPEGASTRWTITATLRKLYIT